MPRPKKLVLVLTTSVSIIGAIGEDVNILEKVPYIHYLVQLQKKGKEVTTALINSSSEINVMTLAYTKDLGLRIWQTNIGA